MKHLPSRRPALQPVALAVALLLHGSVQALPQDPRASFGRTQVTQTDAGTLRIEQSTARAGIDWRSFSIGAGERVTIVQPSARAVLFNRVDGLDPSVILGRLDANGRVFLTNPRGVIFGAGAQVDVGSLVASSLSVSEADARAGRWWLGGDGSAGEVRNEGTLRARDGTVALVAPQVHNDGTIEARRVALGAVGGARVDLDGDGKVLFATRPVDGARLDQLGTLVADGGRAELQAAARGQLAGSVLNLRGAVFARGLASQGGEIVVDGGTHGIVEVGATLDASAAGGRGGQVTVLGDLVLLDGGARLDASGRDGGGAVRVGGDYQGKNPALHHAARVAVREGARLDASATGAGHGGTVIVWSDEATRFAGHADVRGGAAGGDGGLVEVSGKQFLDYAGSADRRAPRGRDGRLLLDPTNLTIQPGSPDLRDDNTGLDLTTLSLAFAAPGTNSVITAAAVESQLAVGSVTLQATDTIDVFTSITSGSSNSLTLQAGNHIVLSGSISVGGNLTLSANDAGTALRSGSGAVSVFGSVAAGGRISLSNGGGTGVHQLAGDFTAATVAITGTAELLTSVPFSLSGSSTLNGRLTGSGGLVKHGSGTLTLGGSNTYTGGTQVADGRLRLAGANAAGSGGIAVDASARMEVVGDLTIANNLQVTSAELVASGGSAVLAGGLVSAGVVQLSSSGGGTLSVTGAVSGSGTLVANGGTVALGGTNTHTGGTQAQAGTLRADAAGAFGSASAGVSSGATLDLGGLTIANPVVSDGGAVTSSRSGGVLAGSLTLNADTTLAGSAGTLAVSGPVGGSAGLQTSGSVTLSGSNSFGGSTTVGSGTLRLSGGSAVPDGGEVVVGSGAHLTVSSAEAIGALSGSGSATLNATLTVAPTATAIFEGDFSGSGALVKSGSGTLILRGDSAHTGGTQVGAGSLRIDTAGADVGSGTLTVGPGATLNVTGGATVANAITLNGGTLANTSGIGSITGAVTLTADSTLSSTGSGLAISGAIGDGSGNYGLGKAGIGDVTLSGSNSFGGAVTVDAGVLVAASGAALGDAVGGTTVNSGGALQIAGVSIGGEALSLVGTGGSGRAGANGALLGTGNARANGTVTLGGNTSIGAASGATLTLGGTVTETPTSALRKIGSGTLVLAGPASHGGGTFVDAGTLRIGVADALPGAITVAAPATLALDVNDSAQSLTLAGTLAGSGTLSAPSVTLAGGTVNANLGSGSLDTTASSTINGSVASDAVVINGGTLTLGAAGRLTAQPVVVVNASSTLATGGAETVSDLAGSGSVVLAGRLTVDTSGSGSFGGIISGSGGLTKAGTGSFTLTGQSTYTGSTRVEAGSLLIGVSDALPTTTSLFVADGAEFNLGGAGLSQTVASFTGGSVRGSGTLTAASFDLGNGDVDGDVTLSGGSAIVRGTFALNGVLDVDALQVTGSGALTAGAGDRIADRAALTVDAGGSLTLGGNDSVASLALAGTLAFSVGGSTLSAATYTLGSGALVSARLGSGALTVEGSSRLDGVAAVDSVTVDRGTLTLGSSNRFSAAPALTIAGGTLALAGSSQQVGSFTLAGGTLGSGTLTSATEAQLQAGTVNATLAGSAGVRKSSSGTVTLAAASTYSGTTSVDGGVLRVRNANALGSAAAGTTVAGGTLLLDGVSLASEALTLSGIGAAGAGALAATGSISVGGTVTLAGDARIGVAAAADTLVVTQTITDGGAGHALTKTGDGTLRLDGTQAGNTWRGTTTIAGGTLQLGATDVLSDLGSVVIDGGTLELGTRSDRVASFTLRDGTLTGSSGVLTSGGTIELQQGSVDALLAGDAGLLKSGSGSVTLSRTTSYPGATTLNGGTLVLDGAQRLPAGTALTIGGGATLDLGANALAVDAFSLVDGTLDGSATLTSASPYDLRSGSVFARLGGAVGVDKTGSGSVTLANDNPFTGAVQVQGGTLAIRDAGALGNAAQGTTVAAGATLQIEGVTLASEVLTVRGSGVGGAGALVGVGNAGVATAVTMAADTTIGARSGATLALDSPLGDGGQGHALTKAGAGTLLLRSGTTHGGATTVAGGTLQTAAANQLPDATALTVAAGATLALGGDETVATLVSAGQVLGSGLTLQAASYTLQAGAVIGANLGSGPLVVTGDSRLDGTAGAATVALNGGTLTLGAAERLSDAAAVTVADGATLRLTAAERVGSFTLTGGTLAGPGVLEVDRVRSIGDSTITGASSATRIEVETGSLTIGQDAALSSEATVTVGADTSLVVQGQQRVGRVALDGGTLAGSGTLAAKTLTATGTSTLSGRADVSTLTVEDTLTLASAGRLVGAPSVVVNDGATLTLGGSETIGRLQGGGSVSIGAGTLSAGAGGSTTFDGVLGGAGGFTKVGEGTTFTLTGRIDARGPVRVAGGTLATAGADRIDDDTTVTVDRGTRLQLGGRERVAALDLSGTLAGSGTLSAATYALGDGGRVTMALGEGRLTARGRSRVEADIAAGRVSVDRGATLTLAGGGRLANGAEVRIGDGGTLVAGGAESVRSLRLDGGTLRGSGLFSALRTQLDDGTVLARLGGGDLLSRGQSRLAGEAAIERITVDGGRLQIDGLLSAAPDVTVQAGTLRLTRAQTLGTLLADGRLELLAALQAARIDARGDALLGAAVTTRGDQRWRGRLQVADGLGTATLAAGAGARIEALDEGNDFGNAALSLRAGSAAVRDGVGDLALGRVVLGDGASAISARGVVALRDRLTLGSGSLDLASDATPGSGRAATGSGGQAVFLPDPVNGAQSSRALVFASEAITQAEGATIETAAGSRLVLRASQGGSITLDARGNRFGGGVSAISGGRAGYDLDGALAGDGRVSRVEVRGDVLTLVAADGGDAVRGDVVVLGGQRIGTADGAVVRARLPYGANQGAATQIAGLTLDTGGTSAQFGTAAAPLAVAVGNPQGATGIGGLLVDVWPAPGSGTQAVGSAVYLGCDGCGTRPYYLHAGDPLAVPTYFNGVQLVDAPPGASAITSATTLLENARRNLFEQAVRTENVAPRLRAGVIAEVGKGRPATEGAGGLRQPELCDAAGGSMTCGEP